MLPAMLQLHQSQAEDVARSTYLLQRPIWDRIIYRDDHERGLGFVLQVSWMGCAHNWSHVHVTDVDARLTQNSSHAAYHAGLVGIAAEEDIAFRYKFCPVATNLHDTRLAVHDRAAKDLHVLVARAGLASEGRGVAVSTQHTQRYHVSKLGRCAGFLLEDLQPALLCQ